MEHMRRKPPETTTDLEEIRGRALTNGDQIGKVFIAIGDNVRRCLICNRMFTRQNAAQHSFEICCPSPLISPSRPICL
jgi:hypothetical protein